MTRNEKEIKKLLEELTEDFKTMDSFPSLPLKKVYTYKGARFEVSLNPQKPGAKYLYRGTVKGLDHTSRTIKLEGGYARRPVNVSKPAEGGSMSEEAAKRVCKVIQDLFGLCQHVLSSPKAQLINPCEMSLAELVLLFGKGFVSQNQKQMKMYQNMLSKVNFLAFELGDMPVKRIRPKVLQDAMTQKVQPDAKLKHVAALQSFLEYIQVRTHYGQQILPFLDEMRSVFCKGKRETDTKRRIVNAANASYLHNEGEATLNKMLAEHLLEDNRFLAIALIKGAGLDVKDIIALRLKDILPDKQDPRKTFISLRREYANSATQIYTFPMLPYESLLLRQYLAWLKTQGPDCTEPDRYLISNDSEGREPMPKKGFNAFVRCLLMKVVVGYADRLGNPDLSKQKGVAFVKNTYRHRLEEYCGLTQQPDSDALTFLLHQSLAGHVQGDNYRCFTDDFGSERLMAYVMRDQRFIPPHQKGQKQVLKSKDGDSDVITFRNWEHQKNRRIVLTFEAADDGEARFTAPYGALFRVEKLPPEQSEQNPTEEAHEESETANNQ